MNIYKRIIVFGSSFLLVAGFMAGILQGQTWTVPDSEKEQTAPFRFTEEVVKQGADLYGKNCQSCHGQPGKANWAKLAPEPGDPASEKFAKDSDGDLFYKITTGRGPMPQFRNVLGEDDRWSVIAFLRTFHKGYVQPDPELAKAAAKGGKAAITMKVDSAAGKILFTVIHTKEGVSRPAAGAGIMVFVKRYFGLIQVGSVKTNDRGVAGFDFPKDLPGDSLGSLVVTARLDEAGGYGKAERTDTLMAGKPVVWTSLTAERAMWNVRAKAPLWLVLTYSIVLIGVGITLVYILFQIRKIHHTGRAYDVPDDPMMS